MVEEGRKVRKEERGEKRTSKDEEEAREYVVGVK